MNWKDLSINDVKLSLKLLLKNRISKPTGLGKKMPKVLQLPITYKCNSKCVMCNIWQMDHSGEMDLDEFTQALTDPIFSNVRAVGINGGEPTLIRNLDEYAAAILQLPKITALNIITHGFNKKQLMDLLPKIKQLCAAKGVTFHVSISLDGMNETHNKVRGLKVFDIVSKNILEINSNMEKYCDSFDVGCTVVRQNVYDLPALYEFSKCNKIPIKYRLGIENKRIESDQLTDQYKMDQDEEKLVAAEFFHFLMGEARNLFDKFKYFSIWAHLTGYSKKRLLGCHWQENGLTMDSRGDVYYCAVASDKIGSVRGEKVGTGKQQFFDAKNLAYRAEILKNDCDTCIHDYWGTPTYKNVFTFFKYFLSENLYWINYRFKS